MKEQDAAHSFEKALEDYKNKSIIDFLCGAGSYDGYWWGEEPNDKRPPFWWRSKLREEFESKESELTRLRSELEQRWTKIDGKNYPVNTLLIVWNGTYNFAHFNTAYNKWVGQGHETTDTRNLMQFPPTHFMEIPEQPKFN